MPNNSIILLRNFQFKKAYKDWIVHNKENEILTLKNNYEDYLLHNSSDYIVAEKGNVYEAILWNHLDDLEVNVSYMLDYFRQRVISLGYYLYMSDQKNKF